MSARANPEDGFDVIVSDDGSLTVPAAELARRGVRPGAHVRLVPAQRRAHTGRHAGALIDTVSLAAVNDLIAGLNQAKAERATMYGDA